MEQGTEATQFLDNAPPARRFGDGVTTPLYFLGRLLEGWHLFYKVGGVMVVTVIE